MWPPGERPSRGLLRDYNLRMELFEALVDSDVDEYIIVKYALSSL